jgi:hypothetical protein
LAERQIIFYACEDYPELPSFDLQAAVSGINKLSDDEWRIVDGESHIAVIVDSPGSQTTPAKLRLLRIRADAPFRLTAARKLTPVKVAQNESITEFTWVLIWPDRYMGAISSRDAPGHKKLANYFLGTSDQGTKIVNLFRPDIAQRLKILRSNGLRKVQVKIRTSTLQQKDFDAKKTGLSAFFNAGKPTEAASIGVELSVGRSGVDAKLSDEIGAGVSYLSDHVDAGKPSHQGHQRRRRRGRTQPQARANQKGRRDCLWGEQFRCLQGHPACAHRHRKRDWVAGQSGSGELTKSSFFGMSLSS